MVLVQGKSLFIHRVMQCNRSVNNLRISLMPTFRALQEEKMIEVKCDVNSFAAETAALIKNPD